jgi:DNA-binding NarL/FixJ family response regulator
VSASWRAETDDRADRGGRTPIVIVEDEDLYRDLLRIALSQQPDIEVVGVFADSESALVGIPRLRPRVAVLDIELPGGLNGVQLGLRLRGGLPNIGIILLSNHADPEFVAALPPDVLAGWSYLQKRSVSDVAVLQRAIVGATSGLVTLDPGLVTGMRPRAGGVLERLTPRQLEILALMAQGFTNRAIGERLYLAEKSIENQINAMYQQLDIDRRQPAVHSRVRAVLAYLQASRLLTSGARDA